MILSRLVAHLKQQHWTGVLIELVIVVLGVFIGLQVNNWNDDRRDRVLERQYLGRLREDFALSVKQAADNVQWMQEQFELEGKMVERLRDCSLDPAQRADFARGIYVAGRFESIPLVRGTIDELKSTGRLGLIRSVDLRRSISNAVQAQESNAEVHGRIVARHRSLINYVDFRKVLLQPPGGFGSSGPTPDQVQFDFPALCHDPAYVAAVSSIQEAVRVVIKHDRARLADYQALLSLIETELAK